jgi:hypothetical protein
VAAPAPEPAAPEAVAPEAVTVSVEPAQRERVATVGDVRRAAEAAVAAATAATQEEFPQGAPSKEGLLTKQGGSWQSWRKRWFVLSDNTVSYYDPDEVSAVFFLSRFCRRAESVPSSRRGKSWASSHWTAPCHRLCASAQPPLRTCSKVPRRHLATRVVLNSSSSSS